MQVLLASLGAGVITGTLFGVKTLMLVALLLFLEVIALAWTNGAGSALFWLLCTETVLQFGYLAGVFLRSIIERSTPTMQVFFGRTSNRRG
jgi:hypothetical protein